MIGAEHIIVQAEGGVLGGDGAAVAVEDAEEAVVEATRVDAAAHGVLLGRARPLTLLAAPADANAVGERGALVGEARERCAIATGRGGVRHTTTARRMDGRAALGAAVVRAIVRLWPLVRTVQILFGKQVHVVGVAAQPLGEVRCGCARGGGAPTKVSRRR